jgi:hypothetical protein
MEPELIKGAPAAMLSALKAKTTILHERLSKHEIALGAVKLIAEGLAQAMAAEIARQKNAERGYGAGGAIAESGAAIPVALDRLA